MSTDIDSNDSDELSDGDGLTFEERVQQVARKRDKAQSPTDMPAPNRPEADVSAQQQSTRLLQGALDEARKIDWPTLPEALGNTAVVVGIVIGSSAVLTTINAVLSRIAARVF